MDGTTYHHGDLRTALLEAAHAELDASGLEGLSMRKVARRAGVSHAAPAHHFADANGLLTALAAYGYERFIGAMQARCEAAAPEPEAQLDAAGLGYVDFALQETALFRLIHASERPDHSDAELCEVAARAYSFITHIVMSVTGKAEDDPATMRDVAAVWAMAHGLADLISAGRLVSVSSLPPAQREGAVVELMRRSLPL
ncbi:MAG: TetR/AcrR family transcriptional regulator [Pseudomonadota bacterium]